MVDGRRLGRALLGEFFCTLIFLFTICAVGINESLARSDLGPIISGISTAFVATAIIYAFGPISGAHFNPAVTVGAMAARKIDPFQGLLYIVLQVVAGVAAIGLIYLCYPAKRIAKKLMFRPKATWWQAMILEFILTFILVYVIAATAMTGSPFKPAKGEKDLDEEAQAEMIVGKARSLFAPIAIGLTLGFLSFLGSEVSGGAFNPARVTAPALLHLDFSHVWVYWVGDLLGGLTAATVHVYGVDRV